MEALSAQVHLSKNYFRSEFCQILGISPQEYLSQVRLSHARQLLAHTSQPLSDVAAACGYESQSYLTYIFKRHTGQTPLHYRRDAAKKGR